MRVLPGSQSQGTNMDCFTSWYLFPSVVDKPAGRQDYKPLILPIIGHAEDPWDTQLQPGVPGVQPASTCLGIWFLGDCHVSVFSGIHQSWGPRS